MTWVIELRKLITSLIDWFHLWVRFGEFLGNTLYGGLRFNMRNIIWGLWRGHFLNGIISYLDITLCTGSLWIFGPKMTRDKQMACLPLFGIETWGLIKWLSVLPFINIFSWNWCYVSFLFRVLTHFSPKMGYLYILVSINFAFLRLKESWNNFVSFLFVNFIYVTT
jgi:hypothetical protein